MFQNPVVVFLIQSLNIFNIIFKIKNAHAEIGSQSNISDFKMKTHISRAESPVFDDC